MAVFWQAIVDFFAEFSVLFHILLIIVIAGAVNWVLRILLRSSVNRVVLGVKKAQNVEVTAELVAGPYLSPRAVQRTRTLGSIGRNVITWTVATIALVFILSQLKVNLTAVLASAGVIAAGLAFGAQNIVKDFLNGIFMVVEDQLGVGDIVTIGEVTGTVEDVGIRVTQVRANDGTLWFIRNGEILKLGNFSQGWGRAIIDVTVDAANDIDAVEDAALEAGRELLTRPDFARRVTGHPEVLGLESVFGDRATIRLMIRTRPEAQWAVQRELRAIVKKHFQERGIALAAELPKGLGGPVV